MPKKRANNEGNVKKRSDGRWEARMVLDDGRRKSFYGKTRQDVSRMLNEAMRDRDKGLPIVGDRQTVAQYIASWLKITQTTVKRSTWIRYERFVRLDVLPNLGAIPLSKLSPQHIQTLYAERLAAGVSPTSIIHLHALLHHALNQAMQLGLVQRNVVTLVRPPRRVRHDIQVLAPTQLKRFLEAATDDPLHALFVLAITTGMREGELLALRWRNVDLQRNSLQVRETVQRIGDAFVFSEPKTTRSRRTVALTGIAVEALRRHQAQQEAHRSLVGLAWEDNDLVFPNGLGRPLEFGNLKRRHLMKVLKKAGLPPIRFHDLRHTAATLLLLQGVNPKVVSEMLGHSSIAITLDLYSHVLPDMQQEATRAMERFFED